MKRALQISPLIVSGGLIAFIVFLWAWSYRAPHSMRYTLAWGEMEWQIDRGLIVADLVRGDVGYRGFEWDSHRRSAGWGREWLEMSKPVAGFGRFLADHGFAMWSYNRSLDWVFGPMLPGNVVFCPFWFVLLLPISLLAWRCRGLVRRCRSVHAMG